LVFFGGIVSVVVVAVSFLSFFLDMDAFVQEFCCCCCSSSSSSSSSSSFFLLLLFCDLSFSLSSY
jgi:hypothetical protein